MSNSCSIRFQAGPYNGWDLTIDRLDRLHPGDRLWVRMSTPDADHHTGAGYGSLVFLPETPGFHVVLTALNGTGREPMEKALTWILDQTAEHLSEDDTIDPNLRDEWQPIVDAGIAARVAYEDVWGNGTEPAFEVVGALVATVECAPGGQL